MITENMPNNNSRQFNRADQMYKGGKKGNIWLI